jgi:hypothetical protein
MHKIGIHRCQRSTPGATGQPYQPYQPYQPQETGDPRGNSPLCRRTPLRYAARNAP